MLSCFLLAICVVLTHSQVATRVEELEINSAVTSDNLIVISGLNVYRDELVLLDTYSGIISVQTEGLSVEKEYFDSTNITHVYSTVDDVTGVLALCTNKKGRCQYMNVTTLSVLGNRDGLMLAGEQEEEVDIGVLVLLANTNTNIPSVFIASGNAAIIGKSTTNPKYPIITAQLMRSLSETANLVGLAFEEDFDRLFKGTFKSGGFVYFVTEDQETHIRITRICEDDSLSDTDFHSLYQTTLTPCGGSAGVIDVFDVSLSVLSNGEYVVITYEDSGNTSVCAYSLSSINQAMTDTYQSCVVDGIGTIPNLGLFAAPATLACTDYESNTTTYPECNIWGVAPIEDQVYLTTNAVTDQILIKLIIGDTRTRRITTTSVTDSGNTYYYMYITLDSNIDKYLMSGLTLVEPALERLTFSERITGVKTDQSGDILFAITNTRLLRIPVSDCERHESCLDCVSDRDPLCGWCSVENSCQRQSLCSNSNLTYRWIADDVTECLSVTAISPNSSNINIETSVTISAVNLPELDPTDNYVCMFDTLATNVTAVNMDNSLIGGPVNGTADIQCPVPIDLSPFTQADSRSYSLSLRVATYSADLSDASFLYTVVDCGYNQDCTSCADSSAECGWCLYDNICSANILRCYMEEWVQPSDDSSLCPRIDSISPDSTLIPALEDTSITLIGTNLPEPTPVYNYTCQLTLMGGTTVLTAAWSNVSDTTANISCSVGTDDIPAEVAGSIQVLWGGDHMLRQDSQLNFTTFVCGNQPDCKTCLMNPGCSWCNDDVTGVGNCSSGCPTGVSIFTLPSSCPGPVVTEFSPTSTAVGGVVELRITGQNLNVRGRGVSVTIGATPCGVSSSSNNEIICFLQTPVNSLTERLSVTVDGENTSSSDTFTTLTPVIASVAPSYAPQYGGSVINVTGTNLGVGSSRTLTAGLECDITSQTDYVITCTTRRYEETQTPLMTVTIDQVEVSFIDEFVVLEDPQVADMFLYGYNTQLRVAVASGVLDYELRGTNLGATVTQILEFYSLGNLISTSICTPPSSSTPSTLICPGSSFSGNIPEAGLEVRFQLVMDQVPNVTQPFFTVFKTFLLYPDPNVTESTIQLTEGDDRFLIEIPNIDRMPPQVVSVRERVSTGNYRWICSNTQLSAEGVTCQLNISETGEFDIEVVIGQNANRYILEVTLIISEKSGIVKFLETNMVAIIVVVLLLLVCLFVVVVLLCLCCCCLYRARRRNRQKQEEAEHLLSEMEDIENDLAEKCRKGFAELNTQIEQDSGMLELGKIPVHNFKTFAMRILFPGLHDHPVLHPVEKPRNQDTAVFKAGLQKFEGLLHDRQFLTVMLHAMEENRNFSVRDRCNVASLLTAALYTDMPYLTEVLFELLEELVNKHITRSTSKLLLRRTESVAEKLLADWLAFNLYHHLKGEPSRVMYKMFLGIKGHLESGPVDVLSGRAAKSLSEEKLMRQNVEHAKLDVEVECLDGSRAPCRLLDCDTITQSKIKLMDHMYRGLGYSLRPKLEDVEVELKSAGGGRLQLRDNDMTNEGDDDWRQINTLSHYNIASGMILTVVPRKQQPIPGQVWDYPGTSIYDFGHTQTLSCLLSLDEGSTQVFHLQKSDEGADCYEQTKTLRRRQYGSEIFLPKLVATKRILQSYIDQMFEEVFPDKTQEVPKAIKVLFDFLDAQAELYSVEEDDVTHTWKSNSLPLRFWVNLLKNPEFLLDVAKSASLDAALSVISQAFIDSCSTSESTVSRESPTNKILYHKEVQGYKSRVKDYYKHIKNEHKVDKNSLAFDSSDFVTEGEGEIFYVESAAYGLFSYAQSYQEEIKTRLCNDSLDSQQQTFEEVCYDISENLYMA